MLYLTRSRAHEARPFQNGIDRLFEEMTRGFPAADAFEPSLEVSETAGEWRVKTDLPGVAPEEVEITVTGNVLTLRGEKKQEPAAEGEMLRRSERIHGKFVRTLEFLTDVDGAKVEAKSKHGVLTIVLPKAEAARPKTIAVKVE
jgi:HSP20 family protein